MLQMFSAHCVLWAYNSAIPYVHVINLKIEVVTLMTVKARYSISSVYVEGQSLLFFSHAPKKWGYSTPTPKSGCTCTPKSYAYDCSRVYHLGI